MENDFHGSTFEIKASMRINSYMSEFALRLIALKNRYILVFVLPGTFYKNVPHGKSCLENSLVHE